MKKKTDHADLIRVTAAPSPFTTERISLSAVPGVTLADILEMVQPDPMLRAHAHVFLNGDFIPPENWMRVRPRAGTTVTVRMVPMGGGGKNPLRTVLTVALLAAASPLSFAVAQGLGLGFSAGALGFAATSFGLSVGRAIVGIGGLLAVNALAPPAGPSGRGLNRTAKESPTLFIQGTRNAALPFGKIPRVLGRHRMVPPLGAQPFTETVGNDQYVRMLFVWGYGPLEISNIKIGETPIEEFDGVEIETRQGYDTDPPLTLFGNTVSQNDLQVALTFSGGYQVRTTETDTDEISIDITLPRGLVEFDSRGKKKKRSVAFEIQHSPAGQNDWSAGAENFKTIAAQSVSVTDLPTAEFERFDRIVIDRATGLAVRLKGPEQAAGGVDFDLPAVPETRIHIADVFVTSTGISVIDRRNSSLSGSVFETGGDFFPSLSGTTVDIAAGGLKFPGISVTSKQSTAIRRAVRFSVPRGQYDVRIRRLTEDSVSDSVFDESVWTALRSVTLEDPVQKTGLALTALRIKATDQLNGIVDRLNGVAHSILPDWTGSGWVLRPTSSPASLFREVLQGAANARPLADERLDLARLQAWHMNCAAAGREFNQVIDFDASVREVLSGIAAAGRASPAVIDGKWSVVEDAPQSVPVQHFTPRNSFGFRGEKIFSDLPHGFRVRFINRDKLWQQDERIVYDDGYTAATATKFEVLELPGVTDPDQVWKDGRYHIATARLRPELYSFSADIEHIVCTRGDLIRFTHDVPLFGLMSGRVKTVTDNGTDVTGVTLDAAVTMESGKTYAIRCRLSDGSSLVKTVITQNGIFTDLVFETPFPIAGACTPGDLFLFGESGTESVELLVRSIEPLDDLSARITCVDAAPAVHNADTGAIPAFNSQITVPAELQRPAPPKVTDIQTGEEVLIRNSDGSLTTRIVVTLQPHDTAAPLETLVFIKLREETGFRPADLLNSTPEQVSIIGIEDGETVDILLRYRTPAGILSLPTVVVAVPVIGESGKPDDIQNFRIAHLGPAAHLSWDAVSDLDLSHYRIKFSPKLAGVTWGSAVDLVERIAPPATSISIPPAVGTYLIKAVDAGGRESAGAAAIVSNIAGLAGLNAVATITEDPGFSGAAVNLTMAGGTLRLAGADTVDDWINIDSVFLFDIGENGIAPSGTYDFANALDLGAVYTATLTAGIDATGLDLFDNVDLWTNVDDLEIWDGSADPSRWTATLEVRTTEDDPAGTPVWSSWKKFTIGEYTARAFEWRLVLQSFETSVTPVVSGLEVQVDMPDRVFGQDNINAGAGGITVNFANPFRTTPAIAIAAQNMQTGDYYQITTPSAAGFTLRFFNAGGTGVARTFDYIAKGYGFQQ